MRATMKALFSILTAGGILSAQPLFAAAYEGGVLLEEDGYSDTLSYVAVTDGTVMEESYPDCYPWMYATMYTWTDWTANENSLNMDELDNAYVLQGVGSVPDARAYMLAHPELTQMYYLDYIWYSYGCWSFCYVVEIPVYDVEEGGESELPDIADIPKLAGYTLEYEEGVGSLLVPDAETYNALWAQLSGLTDQEQLDYANAFADSLMEQYSCYFQEIKPYLLPIADAQEAFYTAHSVWEGAGDVNQDDSVGIVDVIALSQALMGAAALDSSAALAADLNGSGMPDSADTLLLMQYLVHLLELPLA